jgi:putative ABC transport system permease protein
MLPLDTRRDDAPLPALPLPAVRRHRVVVGQRPWPVTFILKSAWRSLGRHRLRAALTMLGISIGVAAVVTMVSIGQGAHRVVIERLEGMGNNMLFVEAGNRVAQGVSVSDETMMYEDVVAVRNECPAVALASPHVNLRAQAGFGNNNWNTVIRGVDPVYQDIRNWPMAEGEFFNTSSITGGAKVAVLGQTVLHQLFSSATNPIGETIRLRGSPFKVVGVLTAKGMNVQGDDQDDVVLIPWTTAQRKMLGIKYIKDMYVSAVSRETMGDAKTQISALLRQRHHTAPGAPDDHSFRDYTEIADRVNETNRTMTMLLASVAALALLIGGINTMSIMLVTVTERTREIGVRMAVGARGRHIRGQFIFEAVLLTLVGGVAGVALGVAASAIVARTLEWPTMISSFTIAVSLAISMLVGLVFGYYPALRASSLDPIEALRSD